jgi:hypothetical protein
MPLPSFTLTGNLSEIAGSVIDGELDDVALSRAQIMCTSNVPDDTLIAWQGRAFRVIPVPGRVDTSGDIVNEYGDPLLLLAQDDDLSITGLQWQISIKIPASVIPSSPSAAVRSWWIGAGEPGETIDLTEVLPAVQAPLYPSNDNGSTVYDGGVL